VRQNDWRRRACGHFLSVKRCQWTKIQKVINLKQILSKELVHMRQ
jgi:hypothetical protein